MATGMTLHEETEYNVNLYKAIVYPFTHCINASHLKDFPGISAKLTVQEMQMIQREHDGKGENAGAGKLLDFLYRKPGWFPAFLAALDCEDLKLKELKPRFMKEKEKVDKEWLATHPHAAVAGASSSAFQTAAVVPVANPSICSMALEPRAPTQSTEDARRMEEDRMRMPPPAARQVGMETDVTVRSKAPAIVDGAPALNSDFRLSTAASRMERDAVEMETEEPKEKPTEVPTLPPQSAEKETEGRSEETGTQPEEETEEEYVDGRSATADDDDDYAEPEDDDPEHEYTELSDIHMETDASPMPQQPSDMPEQEVGMEATPQVLNSQQVQQRRRHPRPRTREEHPSLRQAISCHPDKDFEADLVIGSLSTFPGWSNRQEEHKVIHLIRPHLRINGYYVIWYWTLAKRPTVCVAQGGRVITFVVHRSTANPPTFYFNRRQKRSDSLGALLSYHLTHGILYCPQGGEETNIKLIHPYSRQAAGS